MHSDISLGQAYVWIRSRANAHMPAQGLFRFFLHAPVQFPRTVLLGGTSLPVRTPLPRPGTLLT
jgi:hypothetical protein